MIADDDLLDYTRAHADDLPTVRRLERAAVAHVEEKTGYQWRAVGDVIETVVRRGGIIPLSAAPDGGVLDLVESWDGSAWVPVDVGAYYLDGSHITLQLGLFPYNVSPSPTRFRVTYPSGYAALENPDDIDVPENVKQAVLMYVTYWFDNRDGLDFDQLERATNAILSTVKRQTV